MTVQQKIGPALASQDRDLCRAGGIAALALGIGYLLVFVLYAQVGAPPSGGEAWLQYLQGKTTTWWAIVGLSVLTDFLFLPVALALYLALKGAARTAGFLAAAGVALFALLDLAVTWPQYAALITLSSPYAAAGDAQRALYVAAANYSDAVLPFSQTIYSIFIPSFGILLSGLAMRKGTLGKGLAYLSLVTGVLGVLAVVGPVFASALGALIIPASLLTTLWVLLLGYRLYRLSRQP